METTVYLILLACTASSFYVLGAIYNRAKMQYYREMSQLDKKHIAELKKLNQDWRVLYNDQSDLYNDLINKYEANVLQISRTKDLNLRKN